MKFKKLLPIAAVASTAAVVAPLVTSCGIASGSFTAHIGSDGKPDHYYEPKVERKAAGETYSDIEAAKKAYFADVAKNPMIIVDDALYDMFGTTKNRNADAEGTVTLSINIKKFDAEKGTFSGKVNLKVDGDEIPFINGQETKEKANFNIVYTYNEVPLDLVISTETWTKFKLTHVAESVLKEDSNWTASSKGSVTMITEAEHVKDSITYKIDETFNKDYMESSIPFASPFFLLSIDSYYFSLQNLA